MSHELDRHHLDGTIDWDDLHPETEKVLSRRRFLGTTGTASLVLFGAFNLVLAACGDDDDDTASAATSASSTTAAAGAEKTLYERLGGNAAISAVITDFVDRQVVPDTRINTFFAHTDLTRLKQLLTEFTDHATGG